MKYSTAKILSICALTVTALALLALTGSAALVGDVIDNDSQVTANDARFVLRASVGLETLTEEQKLIADIDEDGKISASDARDILRISVGLEETVHLFKKEVTKAPDCTQTGTAVWTCTECDEPQKEITLDALGHSFGEPEILVQVTCESDGTEKYTCTRCGISEDRTVTAGHTPDRPAATCTEDQFCTRGNHIMAEKTGHDTDWGKCKKCNVFITAKYAEQADVIKTKFTEAKTAFDYAYSINSYNAMLDGISWKALPNTREARGYYITAKTACEAALAACGDIAEFSEIKALLVKEIANLTVAIEEADKIIAFCNGNPGAINANNYDDLVTKLETYNAGFWNSDYKDYTINVNKALSSKIVW